MPTERERERERERVKERESVVFCSVMELGRQNKCVSVRRKII